MEKADYKELGAVNFSGSFRHGCGARGSAVVDIRHKDGICLNGCK